MSSVDVLSPKPTQPVLVTYTDWWCSECERWRERGGEREGGSIPSDLSAISMCVCHQFSLFIGIRKLKTADWLMWSVRKTAAAVAAHRAFSLLFFRRCSPKAATLPRGLPSLNMAKLIRSSIWIPTREHIGRVERQLIRNWLLFHFNAIY